MTINVVAQLYAPLHLDVDGLARIEGRHVGMATVVKSEPDILA